MRGADWAERPERAELDRAALRADGSANEHAHCVQAGQEGVDEGGVQAANLHQPVQALDQFIIQRRMRTLPPPNTKE